MTDRAASRPPDDTPPCARCGHQHELHEALGVCQACRCNGYKRPPVAPDDTPTPQTKDEDQSRVDVARLFGGQDLPRL